MYESHLRYIHLREWKIKLDTRSIEGGNPCGTSYTNKINKQQNNILYIYIHSLIRQH